MDGGAVGTLPWAKDKREIGRRPDAIYVPRFRNVKTKHPDFLRGYGVGVLNGSLWTIPVELQFYALVPLIYWSLSLRARTGTVAPIASRYSCSDPQSPSNTPANARGGDRIGARVGAVG